MSSDIAIRVENLGKRYVIGRQTQYRDSVIGRAAQLAASPFSWLISQMREPDEDEVLWALKDVSFEVRRGEVLGIIGRNGAGKSTLLKILSRITEPTEGRAEIHGRVGSLLEVGTGMHPELTGRENIYLNGCILGMRKTEIDDKFDEIVDFSGIEKFIDTPVKRYSSGMRVRLGFAIAAHLEPEILIVDEVLAVGDAEFQKRCLGKMKDVAGHGRTVLFVSHNMMAVAALCDTGILLQGGHIDIKGKADTVVSSYQAAGVIGNTGEVAWHDGIANFAESPVRIFSLRIYGKGEEQLPRSTFNTDEAVFIEIEYSVTDSAKFLRVGFYITAMNGVNVLECYEPATRLDQTGRFRSVCCIPENRLNSGSYQLSLNVGMPNVKNLVHVTEVQCLTIAPAPGVQAEGAHAPKCVIYPYMDWESVRIAED